MSSTTSDPEVPPEYRPGACNIGDRQRRARAAKAAVSFAVAGAIVAAELLGYLPTGVLVATAFVPLTLGFEWAIQAYDAFCVRLALLGRYDFPTTGPGEVTDLDARSRDRVRAVKITAASVLLAGVTTLALVVVL